MITTDAVGTPGKRGRYRLSLALVTIAIAMLVTTALYNNAAAPEVPGKRYAEVIPLLGGTQAEVASRIDLQGAAPVVTASYVLDRGTKILHPISGSGSARPLVAHSLDEVAVDGDNIAWADLSGAASINYYDASHGSV